MCNHIWHYLFQFCVIFNKRHKLRPNICTNATDTAMQCGQILSSSLLVVLIFLLSQQLIQNNNCVLGVCTYFLSKFVVFVENDTKLKSTMPSLCAIEYSELKTESVLASPTNQRPGFQNSFNSQFTLFNCTWAALSNGANRGLNLKCTYSISLGRGRKSGGAQSSPPSLAPMVMIFGPNIKFFISFNFDAGKVIQFLINSLSMILVRFVPLVIDHNPGYKS